MDKDNSINSSVFSALRPFVLAGTFLAAPFVVLSQGQRDDYVRQIGEKLADPNQVPEYRAYTKEQKIENDDIKHITLSNELKSLFQRCLKNQESLKLLNINFDYKENQYNQFFEDHTYFKDNDDSSPLLVKLEKADLALIVGIIEDKNDNYQLKDSAKLIEFFKKFAEGEYQAVSNALTQKQMGLIQSVIIPTLESDQDKSGNLLFDCAHRLPKEAALSDTASLARVIFKALDTYKTINNH
ncbi:MAG: hypothetical protein LW817_06950 [Candidatus Caenarcaniphilales bacterium]|jgi:hypothetical protein|nr:hypothetical protein [Candidatus Caenarcaniphilales bacterium]